MKPIAVGQTDTSRYQTVEEDSAAAIGNTGVLVVSSQAIIRFIESACAKMMAEALGPGEVSVGVGFNLRHSAPSPIGAPVTVKSRIRSLSGRSVTFEVEATHEDIAVMSGTHIRHVVELSSFMTRMAPTQCGPDC